MSKISTYPSADTPLLLSDRLIGTEAIRTPPTSTPLATKNFSLGELLQLFSSNFPAASLQAVLNTGNTATQNITLVGTIDVTLIKPDNIEDTSGSQGTVFQYLSKGTSSINWVDLPIDSLQAVLDKGNTATQNITLIGNITSTRIIPGNIQDELNNLGTTGQFLSKTATGIRWVNTPTPTTPGLGDVLATGNAAINDINLTGNFVGTSFIKTGGTSLQYLMADGSVTTGGTYTLPVATISTLGGVKIGSGVSVAGDGTISVSTNYQAPLSGSGIVKSTSGSISYISGTSSQFIKGDGSLDSSIYLTGITSLDVTTALGYTPVTNARTLTINGVTYDLTANRSWTISSSPLTTKGDLYTFSTVDARLPVGLDTQILIVDSTTPTGLKWGTNTAATPLGYYGAFSDVTNQTAAAINTGYPMLLNAPPDLSNGVTVVSGSRVTIANTGIYNIQWSAQFRNPDSAEHDVTIWLRKNGVDVPGSSGIISVPKKHGSFDGHVLPSWNFLLDVVAGDYYEFVWSTTDTSVYISFNPAGSPPPSTASVVLTVTQQSGIMAGTGITGLGKAGSIQTGAVQTLAVGTSGTNFDIVSSGNVQTFNLPTASATNRGALSSADWTTFNNKQIATQAAILATLGWYNYKNTTSSSTLTGTLTETQLLQVTIPANTFSASDFLKYTTAFSKTGIIGNCIFRFKLSTSSTMPSGTTGQIGIYTMGSNILYVAVDGRLAIKGGNITGMPFTQNTNVPTTPSASALGSVAFDTTVTQYFYVSATMGSILDSLFLNSTQITNI